MHMTWSQKVLNCTDTATAVTYFKDGRKMPGDDDDDDDDRSNSKNYAKR